MALNFEQAIQRFQDAGMRISKPREALLQLVLDTKEPFSVKTLHERAERAGLNMHLATVHRNLSEFVQVGLVDEIPGEDNRLYVLHQEQESTAHLFCLDCRQMVALDGANAASQALGQIAAQRGFDADTLRLMVAAHCTANHRERCEKASQ